MKFQIGDRVKFLNEKGGGVVSEILGINLVNVTTTDGFEIPYSAKDLISVEENSATTRMFNTDVADTKNIKIEKPKTFLDNSSFASDSLILYPSQKKSENYAAYLAFVPHDQAWLISGDMSIYLINVSEFSLYVVVYQKNENDFKKIISTEIKPFSRYLIAEMRRDDLNFWENTLIQTLIIHNSSTQIYAPIDTELEVRGSKFYKDTAYQNVDYMKEKSVIFRLFNFRDLAIIHQLKEKTKKVNEIIATVVKQSERNDEILKYKTTDNMAVVDMHIWELVDDLSSMTDHEMLLTQIDYFNKCLLSAIEHHFLKVVFIHGVGKGRLKEEIKEILDEKEIQYRPASMRDYGVGATEVSIPQNYNKTSAKF
ncbi:MAG: hypothetical protein AUJ98_09740 [Bacteroidetes bacterium CG2_30_33_31]|nr:MAG: hypothetical protein AUJ98_09740 [Bacteroidetes bacterium CG2_30_33_31]